MASDEVYVTYDFLHWEEPDKTLKITAKNDVFQVTPEALKRMLDGFFPIGYQEGEVTIDVSFEALKDFWKQLGGTVKKS